MGTQDWQQPIAVQVRLKNLEAEDFRRLAMVARELLGYNVVSVLNGDLQSALDIGYDGVHLPQQYWRTLPQIPSGMSWVSASVHSVKDISQVKDLNIDSLVVAPVFQPSWKPVDCLGIDGLKQIVEASNLPVYALGGINPENFHQCLEQGAHGIAVLSSVSQSIDPFKTIDQFLGRWIL